MHDWIIIINLGFLSYSKARHHIYILYVWCACSKKECFSNQAVRGCNLLWNDSLWIKQFFPLHHKSLACRRRTAQTNHKLFLSTLLITNNLLHYFKRVITVSVTQSTTWWRSTAPTSWLADLILLFWTLRNVLFCQPVNYFSLKPTQVFSHEHEASWELPPEQKALEQKER